MEQQPGFGFARDELVATSAVEPVERIRLSKQCRAILYLLEFGPATNMALALISLKYTSRVSDLRAKGYVIECYDRDHATGLTWYRFIKGAA